MHKKLLVFLWFLLGFHGKEKWFGPNRDSVSPGILLLPDHHTFYHTRRVSQSEQADENSEFSFWNPKNDLDVS